MYGLCVLMVSADDIDRLLWCQNLEIARYTLSVTFSNTAFMSHTFRSVLVRFADRGLVLQGRPNLKLFSQLFWLILIPYCCIGLMMAPLASIVTGRFPQTYVAKICILPPGFKGDPYQEPQKIMKQVVVPLVVPLLHLSYVQYWTYKVRKYFRGTCPNRKMSSFGHWTVGGYMRRLFDPGLFSLDTFLSKEIPLFQPFLITMGFNKIHNNKDFSGIFMFR